MDYLMGRWVILSLPVHFKKGPILEIWKGCPRDIPGGPFAYGSVRYSKNYSMGT